MDLLGGGRIFSAGRQGEGGGRTLGDDQDHISQPSFTPYPPIPESEWGQLSRGGVEWVESISQHRK